MLGRNTYLLIARIPPKVMLMGITSLALAAGVLVESEMQKKDKQLANEQREKAHKAFCPLLVASRDIPEGAPIGADALRVDSIESGRIPVGALQEAGSALGMQAKFAIHAGDSILSQNLQLPRRPQGFAAKIRSGYRAITFPVDASTGVAGFLAPDCRVDILAQTGMGTDAKAVPILSDVQVVAVGQTYEKKTGQDEAQPTSCVTVAVLPGDGQKLINAMSSGKLYCLMRNQVDHAPLAVRDISSAFAKAKSTQAGEVELSSIPPAPALPSVVAPPAGGSKALELPSVPHYVDIWSANRKNPLSFPQE